MGKKDKFDVKINEQIRFSEVRLVGDNVEVGVYSMADAKRITSEKGLDLILINENSTPPICKIEDYNKFLYEQKKKQKEQEKKNRLNQVELKEIRFGPNTDEHDFQFKKKHAENFLKDGDRVRAYVFFKGREIQHKEKGQIMLLRFANELSSVGIVENMPSMEGNKMIIFIKPKK
jgi:translation initiation factor IF-3